MSLLVKEKMKYHIITFGCQMNQSDSERLAYVLSSMGFEETLDEKEADLIVINACSVRQKAIDRIWGKLKEFEKIEQERGKRLYTALTGCVLPDDRPKFAPRFDLYFQMKDLPKLPEYLSKVITQNTDRKIGAAIREEDLKKRDITVEDILQDRQIDYSDNTASQSKPSSNTKPLNPISQVPGAADHYLQIKPKYTKKFTAYVPIMTGCNAFCTYCAVPYTRGREVSRRVEEIVDEVLSLVEGGVKEIILLGQIINKYMVKIDESLDSYISEFLARFGKRKEDIEEFQDKYFQEGLFKFHHLLALINIIDSDFWLRFTSSHPKWFTDELISTIKRCDKIPPHIHLPVQAGADTTLKRMLRPYTVKEYKDIIDKIKENIPDVAITTDCIVGFCGETDEEFQQTVELFEYVQYDMAYIAQYSPRPGTKAAKEMKDDVPHNIKKQREKILTDVLSKTALAKNKKYLDKKTRVLVESAKEESGKYFCTGKTGTFKTVKFYADSDLTGEFADVKITKVGSWGLYGEYIKD